MPQKNNNVSFRYGLQDTYNNSAKDLSTVYFCTDTQRLFVGDTEYTRPVSHGTALPDGYLPPNSFFVVDNEDSSRELHYSKDGASWEMVSILPKKITGGVFGINLNLTPSFGDSIVIPRIQVNEYGSITSAINQTITLPKQTALVRIAENVTSSEPEIIPGTFVFDTITLALYVDMDASRSQIQDPLKLSLTGGKVKGTIEVVNSDGTTVSSLKQDGTVSGKYIEVTGDIHIDTPADTFAVIDETGKIRSRTKEELQSDIGLGALAYKNQATGVYTPVGKVSAPKITVNSTQGTAISSITPGDLPKFSAKVQDETLTLEFNAGTQVSFETIDIIKSIESITASEPEFAGTESNINVK